jgi:hypothetical protein
MATREGETDKGRYIKLLEKYDWDLWGHFAATSARDSRREIIERFEDWLDDLEEEEGDQELRWVRTYEKGHGPTVPFAY